MTQAKELLGAIKPQNELELLIDGDSSSPKLNDSDEAATKAPAKAAKGKTTRRSQTKKKHYTEDSIRLYLS